MSTKLIDLNTKGGRDMTDISLILPVQRSARSPARTSAVQDRLRLVSTHTAFALSVAFSFALVLGVVH